MCILLHTLQMGKLSLGDINFPKTTHWISWRVGSQILKCPILKPHTELIPQISLYLPPIRYQYPREGYIFLYPGSLWYCLFSCSPVIETTDKPLSSTLSFGHSPLVTWSPPDFLPSLLADLFSFMSINSSFQKHLIWSSFSRVTEQKHQIHS